MKKRLFTMLLLLCLLLTALTATVAAESTNANGGHLEFTFNGRTVTFVLSFNYVCKNNFEQALHVLSGKRGRWFIQD